MSFCLPWKTVCLDQKFLLYAIIGEERIKNKDEAIDAYSFFYGWSDKLIGLENGYEDEGEEYNEFGSSFSN